MRAPFRRVAPLAGGSTGKGVRGLRYVMARHGADVATVLALLGVAAIVYAEFLDVYRVVSTTGAVLEARGAGTQHSHALLVIGLSIGGGIVLARLSGRALPALAAAALGVVALTIVLIGDLPDVTSSGLVSGPEAANAEPAAGFWLQLVGAPLATGAALALARVLSYQR